MQNLPRIFIDAPLEVGKSFPLTHDQLHYLQKIMRVSAKPKQSIEHKAYGIDEAEFLIFNKGQEFGAKLVTEKSMPYALCLMLSERVDPSNNLIFAFAPIKQSRMEEMLNAATQMGVAKLQPVITDRTVERFSKWERIRKIIIEASEQSGRNSVPELLPPQKFFEFLRGLGIGDRGLVFADERFVHDATRQSPVPNPQPPQKPQAVFVGPEGGFSPAEFAALDAAGAVGISLGKTILRAEVAAVVALAKII